MTTILFNKPFGVLSQFTDAGNADSPRPTLSTYIDVPGVYAAGRLDRDSEGLMVLTDDGALQNRIASPRHKLKKSYWVQIEGLPDDAALAEFRRGLTLKDGPTKPAQIERIDEPHGLWERNPPVRFRKSVPDCWVNITIAEGKNRQIRRMTAAIGHPTLRLIRHRIGQWQLGDLQQGAWQDAANPDF